jgi:hypothetical protein
VLLDEWAAVAARSWESASDVPADLRRPLGEGPIAAGTAGARPHTATTRKPMLLADVAGVLALRAATR